MRVFSGRNLGIARTAARALFASLLACAAFAARAEQPFIVVASTTSTEQSGLFPHLLPEFTKETGIAVHVVAQGTGQALDTARRGDADVVFVHDKPAELKFVAEGHGLARRDVMYNDFVVVGPKSDPAGIKGGNDVAAAFRKIAESKSPFVSRGDRSGTHSAELRYWKLAQVDPNPGKPTWYREAGSGMGPTLNIASGMNAYTLSDRGTWLHFKNRGDLEILVQGDPRMFNQYGVIVVNPKLHPNVKFEMAKRFADWVVSPEGQRTIAAYKINGEQLFFPNASK